MVMVFVTLILVNTRERMHWLVWMIVVSIGFSGVKGGAFTILHGGTNHVLGPAKSFIADNNDLAQALCMILPLMRYLQLQASKKFVRVGLGLAMLLTGVGILGTYSRGGLIALAVVSVALFLKGRKRIPVIIVIGILGFTAYQFMPPQWTARMNTLHDARDVNSAQTRIQSWKFATNVALHRPLVGGGFDVYESPVMWERYGPEGAKVRAVHSIYFRVLGEQGFPGLILYLALLFTSWKSCSRIRKRMRDSPTHKWAYDLGSMLQVSLLAYLTAGLATTSSYFDLSYQLMAMCALLSIVIANEAAQSDTREGAGNTSEGISHKRYLLPRNHRTQQIPE
jgi:probable O-glycosylation ligase (exosortase A-associated)